MYRVLSALVLSALLLLLTTLAPSPAAAGDYDHGGSYRSYDRSYSSSSCCYRRVVRYERVTSESYERPYYRRHQHDSYYDGSSYRTSRYYEPPRHYYGDDYASSHAYSCHRVQVYDGRGGWVWAKPEGCY